MLRQVVVAGISFPFSTSNDLRAEESVDDESTRRLTVDPYPVLRCDKRTGQSVHTVRGNSVADRSVEVDRSDRALDVDPHSGIRPIRPRVNRDAVVVESERRGSLHRRKDDPLIDVLSGHRDVVVEDVNERSRRL